MHRRATRRAMMLFALVATALARGLMGQDTERPYSKRTYAYGEVAGCPLQADVYRAQDSVVRPVVFWIHGGALMAGDRGNVRADQLDRYIQAGFAVVSIDYRLAPETKLPQILEDVQGAYHWVCKEGSRLFHIDPTRIAVVGHSAGGYLALTSGYRCQPRPRAIVAFYGYGDIAGQWYNEPDPYYLRQPAVSRAQADQAIQGGVPCGAQPPNRRWRFYLYCRQHGLWPKEVTGADPHTDPNAFDPFCPIRNVTGDYPPTMLLHGTKDTDVPFEQSQEMYEELKQHGLECELIRAVGRGHAFDNAGIKDTEVAADFDRVIAFLKNHFR